MLLSELLKIPVKIIYNPDFFQAFLNLSSWFDP